MPLRKIDTTDTDITDSADTSGDTEGHMPFRKSVEPEDTTTDTDDAEGHKKNFRSPDISTDDTDDAEGHKKHLRH